MPSVSRLPLFRHKVPRVTPESPEHVQLILRRRNRQSVPVDNPRQPAVCVDEHVAEPQVTVARHTVAVDEKSAPFDCPFSSHFEAAFIDDTHCIRDCAFDRRTNVRRPGRVIRVQQRPVDGPVLHLRNCSPKGIQQVALPRRVEVVPLEIGGEPRDYRLLNPLIAVGHTFVQDSRYRNAFDTEP